jgi:hypothetical protein
MRRILGPFGAWLLATGIAVLVAWLGVLPVRKAATPDVTTLSAAEARKLTPRSPSGSPSPKSPASSIPKNSPAPEGFQTVSDSDGGTAFQRTYEVRGGKVTIQFAEGAVEVTDTETAQGFRVAWEQKAPDVTIVTFTSPQQISRIEAFWRDGAPGADITSGGG